VRVGNGFAQHCNAQCVTGIRRNTPGMNSLALKAVLLASALLGPTVGWPSPSKESHARVLHPAATLVDFGLGAPIPEPVQGAAISGGRQRAARGCPLALDELGWIRPAVSLGRKLGVRRRAGRTAEPFDDQKFTSGSRPACRQLWSKLSAGTAPAAKLPICRQQRVPVPPGNTPARVEIQDNTGRWPCDVYAPRCGASPRRHATGRHRGAVRCGERWSWTPITAVACRRLLCRKPGRWDRREALVGGGVGLCFTRPRRGFQRRHERSRLRVRGRRSRDPS
jgi:hypothetical protein